MIPTLTRNWQMMFFTSSIVLMKNLFTSPKITLYLLPFLGGILYASGFPMKFSAPFFLGPIIGLALLFQSFKLNKSEKEDSSWKSEILSVLCFCLGYNLFGYYWIPYTIKVFGDIPVPFNHVVGLLFSLIIAPHLLVFVLGHNFYNSLSIKSSSLVNSWSKRSLLFAMVYTLLEYFTPQQFPSHAGHSWMSMAPRLGLAEYVGAPFYSFINVWTALAIAHFIKNKKLVKTPYIVFSIFFLANFFMPIDWDQSTQKNKTQIRFVQPNIGNFLKVKAEYGKSYALNEVFDIYRKLNARPSEKELDLIIWPETAFPLLLKSKSMLKNEMHVPRIIRSIIKQHKAELITGGYDIAEKKNEHYFETQYNTAFHFGIDGKLKNSYHKMKLIPFGESLPFGPLNPYLAKVIKNISFFAQGQGYPLFTSKSGSTFSAAICYEILFSQFMRDKLNSLKTPPEFILNLTNDSWYGDTAEPHQHLYLAKWRSLEFNTPIVRSTNTGITSIIYPDGSESKRLGVYEKDVLDVELNTTKRVAPTIFQKYGLLPMFSFWLLLIIGFHVKEKFSNRSDENLPLKGHADV